MGAAAAAEDEPTSKFDLSVALDRATGHIGFIRRRRSGAATAAPPAVAMVMAATAGVNN